jgi:hypothetical protein
MEAILLFRNLQAASAERVGTVEAALQPEITGYADAVTQVHHTGGLVSANHPDMASIYSIHLEVGP